MGGTIGNVNGMVHHENCLLGSTLLNYGFILHFNAWLDMINMIKLPFLPRAICWMYKKGEGRAFLAMCVPSFPPPPRQSPTPSIPEPIHYTQLANPPQLRPHLPHHRLLRRPGHHPILHQP